MRNAFRARTLRPSAARPRRHPRPRLTNKSHKRQILVPEAQVNAKVRRITVGAATAERIETIERFQQARPPPAKLYTYRACPVQTLGRACSNLERDLLPADVTLLLRSALGAIEHGRGSHSGGRRDNTALPAGAHPCPRNYIHILSQV